MRRLRPSREGEESGAIAVMAAALLLAMIVATSLAVDIGRTAYVSRDQQGATDRAALDGVREIGRLSPGDPLRSRVEAAVQAAWARNPGASGLSDERRVVRVTVGKWDGSTFKTGTSVDNGFADPLKHPEGVASQCDGPPVDDPGGPLNAVCVDTESWVPFVFGLGYEAPGKPPEGAGPAGRWVTRSAIAASEAIAAISVGSRLVELDLNESPIFSPLLGALLEPLGVTSLPNLTAVGYDGLATASVPLGELLTLDATLLDRDSVVDSAEVNARDFLQVVADGLHADDPTAAAAASTFLLDLKEEIPAGETVDLGELLWVTTEEQGAAADAEVNVFDLVMGAVQVANEEHAIELNLSDAATNPLDDLLGFDLLDYNLHLTIIEAPRIAVGPARFVGDEDLDGDGSAGDWVTWARTSQIDLSLSLDLKSNVVEDLIGSTLLNLVDDLLGSLTCGLFGLCPTETLTVSLSGAQAQADLTSITCTDPPDGRTLGIDATTETASIQLSGRDIFSELGLAADDVWSGLVDPVPGSVDVPGDGLLDIPLLDDILTPTLGMLGVQLGTAEVRGLSADCSHRRLLPLDATGT